VNGYDILWVAHWTTGVAPIVPGANWGGDGWTFWQYTSDGVVPGITGRVDLNRYHSKDFKPVLIP
jgi:lysozyme